MSRTHETPAGQAADPLARLRDQVETLEGKYSAARQKRAGTRRSPSAREQDLMQRLQEAREQLETAERERWNAAERANPRGAGGMTGLDPRIVDVIVRVNRADRERYSLKDREVRARRAVAAGSVPLPVLDAAIHVASQGGRNHRNDEQAWKAEIRHLLSLPSWGDEPLTGNASMTATRDEIRFGDIISEGHSGLAFQVATIERHDDGAVTMYGPGITGRATRTFQADETGDVRVWRPGVSNLNLPALREEEADLPLMARRMLEGFEDEQDRLDAANRLRASQGLPTKQATTAGDVWGIDLKPGDRIRYADTPVTILRDKEATTDRFGRSEWRIWARREDTGQEGYLRFGDGGGFQRDPMGDMQKASAAGPDVTAGGVWEQLAADLAAI